MKFSAKSLINFQKKKPWKKQNKAELSRTDWSCAGSKRLMSKWADLNQMWTNQFEQLVLKRAAPNGAQTSHAVSSRAEMSQTELAKLNESSQTKLKRFKPNWAETSLDQPFKPNRV